jgi:hypothetical protein
MNADRVTVAFVALDNAGAIVGKAFLSLPADLCALERTRSFSLSS